MLIAILPFGAGQFQNESYLLGGLFLAAEAGALFLYFNKNSSADATVEETNKYITAAKTQYGNDLENMSPEDRDLYNKFIADRQKFVADSRKQAQMFIAAFAGLWVIGAVQAVMDDGPAPEPKKKKKARKYGGFAYDPAGRGKAIYEDVELPPEASERPGYSAFQYDFGVKPVFDTQGGSIVNEVKPAVEVEVKWSF